MLAAIAPSRNSKGVNSLGLVSDQRPGKVADSPLPFSHLALSLPNGFSVTFWPVSCWLVGLVGSGPFPSHSPAAHSWFTSGQCLQGQQPGCSENFIGASIKMRAMGVLGAIRSCFIGPGLPDAAGNRRFRGIWFLCRLGLVSSLFGLAELQPGLF